jgi:hypothetical protein
MVGALRERIICQERSMPLMRGRIVGYDANRMTFEFTMMHEAKIVDCEISSTAMDDLAGAKGVRPHERDTQFRRLRETIERVASDMFDQSGQALSLTLRIFSKHVRNR